MSDINIGHKLKTLRMARDLNQIDVAEGVGLSRTAISNIENGRRSVTLNTLRKFASFYKVDISTITNQVEQNSKDVLIDLLERSRTIFESDKVAKQNKEQLYRQLMEIYLNSTKQWICYFYLSLTSELHPKYKSILYL